MSLRELLLGLAAFAAFVAVAYFRRWSWTGFVAPAFQGAAEP